jgi:hypothetical protein
VQDQKSYVKLSASVISYNHFVSDDGDTSARRSSARDRAAAGIRRGQPMHQAGVYQRVGSPLVEQPEARGRLSPQGMQQFLCTGPKTGSPEFFRERLHAHESYFASYGDSFIFRGPIRSADGADNIGTALLSSCRTGRRRTSSGTRAVRQERRISEDARIAVGVRRRLVLDECQ